MQYYRCKCGSTKSWTSMGVPRCIACHECGSDLAQASTEHAEPAPHRWETRYDAETGKPYESCRGCLARRPVLTN